MVNERYYTESESFLLCDGSTAWGDITWHEVNLHVTTKNGSLWLDHLNIVEGGRAYGLDGTEYIVQQVNNPMLSNPGNRGFNTSMRIVLIARGTGQNMFINYHNGVGTTECRGR